MLYWISTDTLLTYSLNNPGGGALCLTDSSKDQVISNQLAVVGLYGAVCLLARWLIGWSGKPPGGGATLTPDAGNLSFSLGFLHSSVSAGSSGWSILQSLHWPAGFRHASTSQQVWKIAERQNCTPSCRQGHNKAGEHLYLQGGWTGGGATSAEQVKRPNGLLSPSCLTFSLKIETLQFKSNNMTIMIIWIQ